MPLTRPFAGQINPIDIESTSFASVVQLNSVQGNLSAYATYANTTYSTNNGDSSFSNATVTSDLFISDKIIHSGDTDTAIRFPAADTVSVETGGVERLSLTNSATVFNETGADVDFRIESDTNANAFFVEGSSGYVGIGVGSPSAPLDVVGSPGTLAEFRDGSAANFIIETASAVTTIGNQAGSSQLAFKSSNSEAMRIDSSGRVGIGTTSPSSRLEVVGNILLDDTDAELRIKAGITGTTGAIKFTFNTDTTSYSSLSLPYDTRATVGLRMDSASGYPITFFPAGFEAFQLTNTTTIFNETGADVDFRIESDTLTHAFFLRGSDGYVGIGTSSPVEALHVSGNSRSTAHFVESGTAVSPGFSFRIDTNTGLYRTGTDAFAVTTGGTERLRFDSSGNILLGGTATPTSSAGNIVLYNGTAPTGNATNGVILYAEDVSASSELKVRDEAGNITTLSPHNFTLIPDGPSENMAWSYYSERDGTRINVDMLKALRVLERLSGEKLVYVS
jgi:hypothetical protein